MTTERIDAVDELTQTLECMRQTLAEREVFIQSLLDDITSLKEENKKLADLIGLLTTERKGE